MFVFFFFKQKTAYEMRISDWSSDVCSSDLVVRKLVEKNTIITGGCIASMLLGEKINDFDLYFTDHATTKAVAEYYVKRFEVKNRSGIPCAISVDDADGRVRIVVKSSGIASEEGAISEYEYFESSPQDRAAGYVGEVMSDPGDIEEAYQETEAAALETSDPTYRPVFMSTNAITLSDKIQIVLR